MYMYMYVLVHVHVQHGDGELACANCYHCQDNAREIAWSETFRLVVVIESNCQIDVDYSTKWQVHRIDTAGDIIATDVIWPPQVDIMFTYTWRMLERGYSVHDASDVIMQYTSAFNGAT